MRFKIVLGVFVTGLIASVPALAADGKPTFTKDVAPIFYKSCIECHRATMFAPFSLTSYEDARPWLRAIKQRVQARTMPPWGSDMPHGLFRNDPRLSDQEVETIVSWIDGGAPKGDMADMPKMPPLAEGWTIGKPDAIYSMTEDFNIPATGTIEYKYIRIPVNLPEDRWYTAVEIKPTARANVHHIIAYTEPSSDKPTRPGNTFGPTNITGVSPNKPGLIFEPGIAKLLRAHQDIIVQIHYTTNGKEAVDRTQIGIIFAKEPAEAGPRHRPGRAAAFVIPAGDPNAEVKGSPRSSRTRDDQPDAAHARARQGHDLHRVLSGRHVGSAAGGAEVRLQLPNHLRAGHAEDDPAGHQDRGGRALRQLTGNKYNPDPTKDVKWGDQTWEEMMIGFWGTVVDAPKATSQQQ
jgi:hypothetical protein